MTLHVHLVLVVCAVLSVSDSLAAQQQAGDWVEIDGKKNPELVPDYAAWRHALRIIGTSTPDTLPSTIYRAATAAEKRLLIDEGLKLTHTLESDCTARLLEAREPIAALERAGVSWQNLDLAKNVDAAMWKIEQECRSETIKSRDLLRGELTAATVAALASFVEHMRGGMSFTVPKNGMERFRQPQ